MPDEFFEEEEETDLSQYDKIALLQAEVERLEESNQKLRKICQKWLGEVITLRAEKKKLFGLIAMSKDQARKSCKSRVRKVWVIRLLDGSEYEAFCKEKQDAAAYARARGLKVDKIYLAKNERWTK